MADAAEQVGRCADGAAFDEETGGITENQRGRPEKIRRPFDSELRSNEHLAIPGNALPIYSLLPYRRLNKDMAGAPGAEPMWEWIDNVSDQWIAGLFALVAQNPEWALAVTFLAAIIEASAILGTVVPGTFIVMGVAGAAAAAGQTDAAIPAPSRCRRDNRRFLSLWVGYRYRSPCGNGGRCAQRPQSWKPLTVLCPLSGRQRGAVSEPVLCLRSTVPLVASIAGMSRRRFIVR